MKIRWSDPRLPPLFPSVQPKEVQEGREEIGVYWREGVATGEVGALLDAARGAIELLFGERPDEHVSRIVGVALPLAIRNWAESGAKGVSPFLLLFSFCTMGRDQLFNYLPRNPFLSPRSTAE